MLLIILDAAAKLLPAVAIIVAVFVARAQLRAGRRATAVTIAKNHYREALERFLANSDVLYEGLTAESYAALKTRPLDYRRYRILFTTMAFSMQEIYFALDPQNEKQWQQTIRIWTIMFRHLINSETDFPPAVRATLHPKFLENFLNAAAEGDHPIAGAVARAP